jgi:hypothetical protein
MVAAAFALHDQSSVPHPTHAEEQQKSRDRWLEQRRDAESAKGERADAARTQQKTRDPNDDCDQ